MVSIRRHQTCLGGPNARFSICIHSANGCPTCICKIKSLHFSLNTLKCLRNFLKILNFLNIYSRKKIIFTFEISFKTTFNYSRSQIGYIFTTRLGNSFHVFIFLHKNLALQNVTRRKYLAHIGIK